MTDAGAIDAARTALPGWVGWMALPLVAAAAFVLASLGAALGGLVGLLPFARLRDGHWSERARHAWPGRSALGVSVVVLPFLSALIAPLFVSPFLIVPAAVLQWTCAAAAFLGAATVARVFEQRMRGVRLPFGRWLAAWVVALTVMWPHVVVLIVLLLAVPPTLDARAVLYLGLGLAALGLSMVGGGVWLARLLGVARPAEPRLQAIVDASARRTGVPIRGAWQLSTTAAWAAALTVPRLVLVSDPLLEELSDEEVAAVIDHEAAHIGEPGRVRALRVVSALALVGVGAVRPVALDVNPLAALVLLFAVFVVLIGASATARTMEQRADGLARAHAHEPKAIGLALEKLYASNLTPAVLGQRRAVHPELFDRMTACGVEPSFARPLPPSNVRRSFAVAAALLPLPLGLLAPIAVARLVGVPPAVRLSLGGGAPELADLALARQEAGAHGEAVPLFAAAAETDTSGAGWYYRYAQGEALVALRRCEDAATVFARARDEAGRQMGDPDLVPDVSGRLLACDRGRREP